MRRMSLLIIVLVGAWALAEVPAGGLLHLDKNALGQVPEGWKTAKTGKGEGSVWKVIADSSAPSKSGYVLAQTAESPNAFFNLCIAEKSNFLDGTLSVAFKAVAGKNDQGGGLVWRYQDADNYYVARMNPLEDNFRVYKVIRRTTNATADEGRAQSADRRMAPVEGPHEGRSDRMLARRPEIPGNARRRTSQSGTSWPVDQVRCPDVLRPFPGYRGITEVKGVRIFGGEMFIRSRR